MRTKSSLYRTALSMVLVIVASTSFAQIRKTFSYDNKSYALTSSVQAFVNGFKANKPTAITFEASQYITTSKALIKAFRTEKLNPEKAFQPSRWFCVSCSYQLPSSYPMKILAPRMNMIGSNNAGSATFAKTGKCPKCSHSTFCMLTETNAAAMAKPGALPNSDVTARDLDHIKTYYRLLAMAWWKTQYRQSKICDRCNGSVKKGDGYIYGDWNGRNIRAHRLLCDNCIGRYVSPSDLSKLQKNRNYYGYGKLEKARIYGELYHPTASKLDENGVPVSFFRQCADRYKRLLSHRKTADLLSGKPIVGTPYMITGGDYKTCKKVRDMYIAYYKKNSKMTQAQAEAKLADLFVTNTLHYHNLAISRSNMKLFTPNPPLGDVSVVILQGLLTTAKKHGSATFIAPGTGVINLTATQIENAIKAKGREQQGNAQFARRDAAGALVEYKKVLQYSPNDWIIYMNIGNCYGMLKDRKRAEKYMEEAKLIPGCNIVRVNRNLKSMSTANGWR